MDDIEQAAQSSEMPPAEGDARQPEGTRPDADHSAIEQETQTEHKAEPKHPSIAAIVDRWWEDHFPGSAVARHTDAWNVAHAAKETLKRLLAAL